MVDEPEHRHEIDDSLQDVYKTLFMTASPTCTKAAPNLLGLHAGTIRLPIVDATPDEPAAVGRCSTPRPTVPKTGPREFARELLGCASCPSADWGRSART